MTNIELVCVLVFSVFFLQKSNADKDFLKCISYHSKNNITKLKIYAPETYIYSAIMESAEKENPRWHNSSSARPLFIASPTKEAQIRDVIYCCRKLGLQIRVKSGGHDYEGLSYRSKTPFVMIDLKNLDEIDIDVDEETAWIQTGVTLGQLYYAIAKKSKRHAFPGGLCRSVGSGGIISGGGIGTLMRKFGLSADNVIDARIMDVNGRILDRESMGEDLFWAIRGGGGASFGVILAWKLKLVRVPPKITIFSVRRKWEDRTTINLLQRWQKLAHKLPRDIFMRVLIQNTGLQKEKFVQVTFQALFLGRVEKLIPLVNQSFPEFGLEQKDCLQEPVSSCTNMSCLQKECFEVPWIRSALYFASRKTNDSLETLVNMTTQPAAAKSYYKGASDFVKTPIPEKGWEMIKNMFLEEDRPFMILDPFGGKMDEIAESQLPFPHRKGNLYNIQYRVRWEDNQEKVYRKKINWLRELYRKMEPYVANSPRTAYINYRDLDLGTNSKDYTYTEAKIWGEKYYKGNFERLAKVKSKVDPSNFFRNEQSIPPFQN